MTGGAAFARRFNVSRETLERLDAYHRLLLKWNPRINLVSPRTLEETWSRHFLDSAQLWDLRPAHAARWIDIGSGGGFPGAVIAILAAELQPGLHVSLVESDQRKAVFLRAVARETDLAFDVVAERVEAANLGPADVVSARALAPLTNLLALVQPVLAADGVALFPKGKSYREELAEALESWAFDCETYPSETDADSVILKIGGIERA